MSLLTATSLAKCYRKRWVVDDVSLQVASGEIVGLLGPNGAGKTTCFYMVVGLIDVDRGLITLNDNNLTNLPMHIRAQLGVGYLPQEPSVFKKLSVADNIRAILQTRANLTNEEQQQQTQNLLDEFHISHLADNLGMSLSGGERRRLEIARSLAAEPSFILLDEPFAGVDPISVLDIQSIVRHLRDRGIGVLITDHNVRETLGICSRAYIVNQGKVIASGTPENILANQQVREVYLGQNFSL